MLVDADWKEINPSLLLYGEIQGAMRFDSRIRNNAK